MSLTPVAERITLNVCTTLESVCEAGGYSMTFTVERPNPTAGNPAGDARVVVVPGQPSRDDPQPIGFDSWVTGYQVVITVQSLASSSTPIDERLEFAVADAERALAVDVTRGGLAFDTTFDPPDYAPLAFNSHTGQVTVNANVRWRTVMQDRYSSAFRDD